ncbi:MAG: hypothetical protein BAA00_09240 [Parageobacillus thermoglucosidasius]|nr:MAG: hypothetical protein BAA00_09240 [Parageobacillus thermoglucosidasius]
MSWIHVQSKTMHILLRKVMTLAGVLVLAITAFSLVNPNQAAAWLHPGSTTQYPTEGGEMDIRFLECHGSLLLLSSRFMPRFNSCIQRRTTAQC